MLKNHTPTIISPAVIRLKNHLNLNTEPIFVQLRVEPWAEEQSCFPNVDRMIRSMGGSAMNGWSVGIIPGVLIEGEFHCVWRSNSGELFDITPNNSGMKPTLLLPDPTNVWSGGVENNIRLPLSSDQLVIDYIDGKNLIYEIWNSGEDKFKLYYTKADEAKVSSNKNREEVVASNCRKINEMLSKKKNQHHPCYCNSGKRYIDCHASQFIRLREKFLTDDKG